MPIGGAGHRVAESRDDRVGGRHISVRQGSVADWEWCLGQRSLRPFRRRA